MIRARSLSTSACLAMAALSSPCLANDNAPCGVVLGVTLNWTMNGRHLTLGDKIPADAGLGDLITDEDEDKIKPSDEILTVWFGGKRPDSFLCKKRPCRVDMPNASAQCPPPKGTAWYQIKLSQLFEEPSRYFTAVSRGLEGELKETVLPLRGPQLDIAPAMSDLTAGVYRMRFESLHDDTIKTTPVQIQWQPGKPALIPVGNLKPDLYRLTLLEESGEPAGSEAWIILSGPEQYPIISAQFEEIVKTVSAWPAEVDPSATRAVLRASLESLAQKQRKPQQH